MLFPWGYRGTRAEVCDTARQSSVCSAGRHTRLEPAGRPEGLTRRSRAVEKRCPAPCGEGGGSGSWAARTARARAAPPERITCGERERAASWPGALGPPPGTSASGPGLSSSPASGAPAQTAAACAGEALCPAGRVPRAPGGARRRREVAGGELVGARAQLGVGYCAV